MSSNTSSSFSAASADARGTLASLIKELTSRKSITREEEKALFAVIEDYVSISNTKDRQEKEMSETKAMQLEKKCTQLRSEMSTLYDDFISLEKDISASKHAKKLLEEKTTDLARVQSHLTQQLKFTGDLMEGQRGADQMYQQLMKEHSVLERKMEELLDSKSKLSEILKGAETTRDLLNTQLAEKTRENAKLLDGLSKLEALLCEQEEEAKRGARENHQLQLRIIEFISIVETRDDAIARLQEKLEEQRILLDSYNAQSLLQDARGSIFSEIEDIVHSQSRSRSEFDVDTNNNASGFLRSLLPRVAESTRHVDSPGRRHKPMPIETSEENGVTSHPGKHSSPVETYSDEAALNKSVKSDQQNSDQMHYHDSVGVSSDEYCTVSIASSGAPTDSDPLHLETSDDKEPVTCHSLDDGLACSSAVMNGGGNEIVPPILYTKTDNTGQSELIVVENDMSSLSKNRPPTTQVLPAPPFSPRRNPSLLPAHQSFTLRGNIAEEANQFSDRFGDYMTLYAAATQHMAGIKIATEANTRNMEVEELQMTRNALAQLIQARSEKLIEQLAERDELLHEISFKKAVLAPFITNACTMVEGRRPSDAEVVDVSQLLPQTPSAAQQATSTSWAFKRLFSSKRKNLFANST